MVNQLAAADNPQQWAEKGWVSKLVARYKTEGAAAFERRSRRPKTNPNATPAATLDLMPALRRRLTAAPEHQPPDPISYDAPDPCRKIS